MSDSQEAEKQVEAFISVAKTRYGLSDDDITELIGELVRLRERAEFAKRMGEYTAKTIIAVLVGAFFYGLGWALYHFVKV
jgi:hypothetical protein